MTVTTIKATKVVNTALGVLEREVVLPNLVWRDAGGDFAGAANDTISLRLPAYAVANTRTLRSGTTRSKSNLVQTKVDVTLDTDIYMDVPISDEELTLDITDFGAEVMAPVLSGVVRAYEDKLSTTMSGATYEKTVALDINKPFKTTNAARRFLNDANVPQQGRALVVGTALEETILNSDYFVKANEAGSANALREAMIGRISGFDVVVSNVLAPTEGYAFHRTAYALSSRAPKVPQGAPWGASQSAGGFAIRTVQIMDPDTVEDRFIADAWVGANVVKDHGTINADGKFVPSTNPDTSGGTDLIFVRSVKIAGLTS